MNRRNGGRLTEQTDKPNVNEDGLSPIPRTRPHENDDEANRDAQVRLKLPPPDEFPNLVRTQLGIAVTCAEHDGDCSGNSDYHTQQVPLPERLLEEEGCDDAVGDESHHAERGDD